MKASQALASVGVAMGKSMESADVTRGGFMVVKLPFTRGSRQPEIAELCES